MNMAQSAARAYQSSADRRSLREQEADLFRRVTATLRRARGAGNVAQARALADNRRLWTAIGDLVRDPRNDLPAPLRASIASIGLAVARELDSAAPDFEFLMSVNENFAAGLAV